MNDLIERACQFHPWDAMSAAALEAISKRGPFRRSAETGCGGSTILLSQISERHVAFAIEGADQTISELRAHPDLQNGKIVFVEGRTKDTLPVYQFDDPLDFVLLDGPHAYPFPQLEFAYLFPKIRVGGWLAIDDLQIPSVHELFHFLKKESSVVLEEVIVRTAFFRRIAASEDGPDGWTGQGINRRPVLRYSWRDRVRNIVRRK